MISPVERKYILITIAAIAFPCIAQAQTVTSEGCKSNAGDVIDLAGAKMCIAMIRPDEQKAKVYEGLGVGVAGCQNPYSKKLCSELFYVPSDWGMKPFINRVIDHPRNDVLGCAKTYALEADASLDENDEDIGQGALAFMRAAIFSYALIQYENNQEQDAAASQMTLEKCSAIGNNK